MTWLWILLIGILIFIGIDYGRLVFKYQYNKILTPDEESYIPRRNIMIGVEGSSYIADLATMDIKAHKDANIDIKFFTDNKDIGCIKTVFENGDELIVYSYEKAKIIPLTQNEVDGYAQKLFFDYQLPEGAERAIIKQLGLLGYMVNIGICGEKVEVNNGYLGKNK